MKIKMNQGLKHCIKHFGYPGGCKKFEPLWNFLIKTRGLNKILPLLEVSYRRCRVKATPYSSLQLHKLMEQNTIKQWRTT